MEAARRSGMGPHAEVTPSGVRRTSRLPEWVEDLARLPARKAAITVIGIKRFQRSSIMSGTYMDPSLLRRIAGLIWNTRDDPAWLGDYELEDITI